MYNKIKINKKNIIYFFIFLIIAFALDQITKLLIVNNLSVFDEPKEVIGSLLRFKLAYNPYGVFSITFGPGYLYYILTALGIVIFGYIGLSQQSKTKLVVFAIIVGGAIGNLFDRIRLKYVIDFIDMGIGNLRWFTYNLSDAFITLSAIYLIIDELFKKKKG